MKLEQAARQALEALLDVGDYDKCLEAITALREALAEQAEQQSVLITRVAAPQSNWKAEQEPVACKHEWFRTGAMQIGESRCIHCGEWNYTTPVRTKDLTDKEIYSVVANLGFAQLSPIEVARAVIAADREKNRG